MLRWRLLWLLMLLRGRLPLLLWWRRLLLVLWWRLLLLLLLGRGSRLLMLLRRRIALRVRGILPRRCGLRGRRDGSLLLLLLGRRRVAVQLRRGGLRRLRCVALRALEGGRGAVVVVVICALGVRDVGGRCLRLVAGGGLLGVLG